MIIKQQDSNSNVLVELTKNEKNSYMITVMDGTGCLQTHLFSRDLIIYHLKYGFINDIHLVEKITFM